MKKMNKVMISSLLGGLLLIGGSIAAAQVSLEEDAKLRITADTVNTADHTDTVNTADAAETSESDKSQGNLNAQAKVSVKAQDKNSSTAENADTPEETADSVRVTTHGQVTARAHASDVAMAHASERSALLRGDISQPTADQTDNEEADEEKAPVLSSDKKAGATSSETSSAADHPATDAVAEKAHKPHTAVRAGANIDAAAHLTSKEKANLNAAQQGSLTIQLGEDAAELDLDTDASLDALYLQHRAQLKLSVRVAQ